VEGDTEAQEITCAPEYFFALRDALENRFGPPQTARVEWRPVVTVTLDEEQAGTVLRLLEALEDSEDVQNVYANLDIPDAVMAKLSA
jgi:transcriptional/translational regulatory protein YebC/TACO1